MHCCLTSHTLKWGQETCWNPQEVLLWAAVSIFIHGQWPPQGVCGALNWLSTCHLSARTGAWVGVPEKLSLLDHVTSYTVDGIFPNLIDPTHIWEGVGIFGGGIIPSSHSQHRSIQREDSWAEPWQNLRKRRWELLNFSSLAGYLSCNEVLSSNPTGQV